MNDPGNHPPHYTGHPSGVECITITEHMGFNLGNAVKYVWRADLKGNSIEDLKKARWYVDREINKRQNEANKDCDKSLCACCGWPFKTKPQNGCAPGDCSQRPRPDVMHDAERYASECTRLANGCCPSCGWDSGKHTLLCPVAVAAASEQLRK